MSVPGFHDDLIAAEGKSYHLLCLKNYSQSISSYDNVHRIIAQDSDARRRDLVLSRAKRYQALAIQAQTSSGSLAAWDKIRPNPQQNSTQTANTLRFEYVSGLQGWDLIEQAETHYVAAYIANRLITYKAHEQTQLGLAQANYSKILEPYSKWWPPLLARIMHDGHRCAA